MSSKPKSPLHWPQDIQYLACSSYHSSVPPDVQRFLRGDRTPLIPGPAPAPRPPVAIRLISDPMHPACRQRGLFATHRIAPKTRIITYIGEIHCDDRPESDYDLSLYRSQDGTNVGVDASQMGNEARFINDYRGIATRPNAVFIEERSNTGELQITIWSGSREIKKGDEILVSYGKGWWKARTQEAPIPSQDNTSIAL